MHALELLFLVVALSLDGLFVGLSFGLRGIRVAAGSLLILAACSGIALALSMAAARQLAGLPFGGPTLSGLILVAVGLWRLLQGWREVHVDQDGPLFSLTLPQLGLVVQVLVDPARADRDQSGQIEVGEAVVLGTALALDAMAVGMAVASVRAAPLLPLWVATGLYLFTRGGIAVAARLGSAWQHSRQRLLPGVILMLLGLVQLGRAGL